MPDPTEAKLDHLVAEARRMGATAAEARVNRGRSTTITVRSGRLETVVSAEPESWTLKLWAGARSASLATNDLARRDEIVQLVERTLAKARLAPENRFSGLATSDEIRSPRDGGDLELVDSTEVDLARMEEIAGDA